MLGLSEKCWRGDRPVVDHHDGGQASRLASVLSTSRFTGTRECKINGRNDLLDSHFSMFQTVLLTKDRDEKTFTFCLRYFGVKRHEEAALKEKVRRQAGTAD